MRIIGCDLHARQQTIAMLDRDTGELEEKTFEHEGDTVREFYSALPGPILVGIEATGGSHHQLLNIELVMIIPLGGRLLLIRPNFPGMQTVPVLLYH
jgi:hypothetical protein